MAGPPPQPRSSLAPQNARTHHGSPTRRRIREHDVIVGNAARVLTQLLDAAAYEVICADFDALAKPDGPPNLLVKTRPVTLFTSVEPGAPVMAIEVSEPNTISRDRMRRFDQWRAVKSVSCLLFVGTDRVSVDLYCRREDHWLFRNFGPADEVRLDTVGVTLPVSALYEQTDVPVTLP